MKRTCSCDEARQGKGREKKPFPTEKEASKCSREKRCQETTQKELMSNKGRERGLPPSPAPENSVPRRATIRRPRRKELVCHLMGSEAGVHGT